MRYHWLICFFMLNIGLTEQSFAQRVMENLDRGLVAIPVSEKQAFISWRLLATDDEHIAFNLYREYTGHQAVKLNKEPLTKATDFIDSLVALKQGTAYYIRPVLSGREGEPSKKYRIDAQHLTPYLTIPLQPLAGYHANDASVGDLDGDGAYEIVLHRTGNGKDNSQDGITDPPILEAYRLDGTFMWRIQLGKNIREGAHYTQFMVYDLDGDGKAEIACKTADGTVDGLDKVIGDASKDWRNDKGRILDGPEFLTVFKGETGEALATTTYLPGRDPVDGWGTAGHNDGKGNRADRFLAGVAYLDGHLPSLLMCRGYYGRSVIAAWDYRNGKLTSRWVFDSKDGENPYAGQGFHNLSIADIDGDGKDEVLYGAMAIDDNGKPLYTTGWGHGDAQHVGDLDPNRPGLEMFTIHERPTADRPGAALRDAKTGKALWEGAFGQDIGRGVAENVDANNPGAELWYSGSNGLLNLKGERIGPAPRSTNFLIWWDGDLTRELLDRTSIEKYGQGTIFTATGCVANNGTKSNPSLSADIIGDWREEVIFPTEDHTALRIYSTTIPSEHRLYTLMHDPQYRLSVAWQNVGYNQPPHTSFYMGEDMRPAPKPFIITAPAKDNKKNQ